MHSLRAEECIFFLDEDPKVSEVTKTLSRTYEDSLEELVVNVISPVHVDFSSIPNLAAILAE